MQKEKERAAKKAKQAAHLALRVEKQAPEKAAKEERLKLKATKCEARLARMCIDWALVRSRLGPFLFV